MAPPVQRPDRPSPPGEVQRLLLSVRPAISDLFVGYAIPEEETGALLRDAVDRAVQHCHRTERPRRLFLQLLEERCAAHVEAQKAEEEKDEDRAPDA